MRLQSCRRCKGDNQGAASTPASLREAAAGRVSSPPFRKGRSGNRPSSESIPEIFEIRGHTEVAAAHELNHSLEVVFLLSRHPNLLVLQLALHFEAL